MGTNERRNRCDTLLWDKLKKHRGHHISIASYGDWDDPENISLKFAMRSSWMPNCILSVEEKMCKGANICV